MSDIRKVPASAGAEWLINGFALFKRAPVALGSLSALWGLISLLVVTLAIALPTLGTALQFLLLLGGPLFMGGMLWAVREVDQGRSAHPSHLLHGLQDGRAPHLLMSLLPQLLAALLLGALLFLLLGSSGLQQLMEVMVRLNQFNQTGVQPDPAEIQLLITNLPAGRILLWLLLLAITFTALTLALFVMPPRVMFDRATGLSALRDSLRASLRNLPAMLVLLLLSMIALFAIYFGVMIVALLLGLLLGETFAMFLAQLLLMAVLMPVFAGAVYTAWKQMFAHTQTSTTPPVSKVFVA